MLEELARQTKIGDIWHKIIQAVNSRLSKHSIPLVETNKLVSKYGILLPVANYGVKPLKNVTFTVKTNRTIHEVKEVKSINFGKIAFQQKGDIATFTLPVKLTDFITLK